MIPNKRLTNTTARMDLLDLVGDDGLSTAMVVLLAVLVRALTGLSSYSGAPAISRALLQGLGLDYIKWGLLNGVYWLQVRATTLSTETTKPSGTGWN